MNKALLLEKIIAMLENDRELFHAAARKAHEAATHEECQPDNKYDTTALEASYIAQGQANRAVELRLALESYRNLLLQEFDDETPIRLTALVTLEDTEGNCRTLFLGPSAGGLKIEGDGETVLVITPGSPLGRQLLGRVVGDEVSAGEGAPRLLTIVEVQ